MTGKVLRRGSGRVVGFTGLVAQRMQGLHHRRFAAVVICAAALALAAASGLLGTTEPESENSIGPPGLSTVEEPSPSARPLTYAAGRTIHYGSQVIDTGREIGFLAVTDDGVVFAGWDNRVWFTDGSDLRPIGHSGPGFPRGWLIESANAGSIVVWWQPVGLLDGWARLSSTTPLAYGSSVRFETKAGRSRESRALRWSRTTSTGPQARTRTGCCGTRCRPENRRKVAAKAYDADQRRRPRNLVADDSIDRGLLWGRTYFRRVGARLVGADPADVGHDVPLQRRVRDDVFLDTRTGEPLVLRLPRGYHSTDAFALAQWLDDDRVSLFADHQGWAEYPSHVGDILICQLSTGRCVVAVARPTSTERNTPASRPASSSRKSLLVTVALPPTELASNDGRHDAHRCERSCWPTRRRGLLGGRGRHRDGIGGFALGGNQDECRSG